ncbi:MAG: EF-P lysine aminoacylase EpmA [Thioalkalivibrio sp.]
MTQDWRPGASYPVLRARAQMLAGVRGFFAERGVMEIETPMLSRAAATDPALESLRVDAQARYLHTSPEFPMKRLLAAGCGDIYQIARVFRAGEAGRFHNPEFTLLEWYRLDFDEHRLMDEVEALVRELAGEAAPGPAERLDYGEAFRRHADLDPHTATSAQLRHCAERHGIDFSGELDRDGWLDLLMSQVVAPAFPPDRLTFIHGYPASQAALARLTPGTPPLAARFELHWGPLELANGFHELSDAAEQASRFERDLTLRERRGLTGVPVDDRLLAALQSGLPDCAGVALGLDRLLMCLTTGCGHIDEVLAFSWDKA